MSAENDQYENLGPNKLGAQGSGEKEKDLKKPLPARTPGQTILGQFALRPGDDVDLSSDRGTVVGSAETGATKKSKSKEDVTSLDKDKEKEKEKAKPKPKPAQIDTIKPYGEPKMLRFCHAITLTLLVISFVLMAFTVVQFVDIFVWLPMLFGDEE
ncbi:hypothetical protein GCK32_018451 [Trichostrongylus colubriformis]|uniref:Transmembrane protein n=1 Tax=Trichostrongylus colubriformis TaxID=6319 RepID=A0AAN8IQJ1_TRICO